MYLSIVWYVYLSKVLYIYLSKVLYIYKSKVLYKYLSKVWYADKDGTSGISVHVESLEELRTSLHL